VQKFKTLSGLVVVAVLAMSANASALVFIDGVEIRPQDLPRVRSQCNSLAAATRSSLTEDQGSELLEPSPDPASSFSRGANSMDNALTRYDLNRLTVRKCREAGLL
jgi:hypothetical protein